MHKPPSRLFLMLISVSLVSMLCADDPPLNENIKARLDLVNNWLGEVDADLGALPGKQEYVVRGLAGIQFDHEDCNGRRFPRAHIHQKYIDELSRPLVRFAVQRVEAGEDAQVVVNQLARASSNKRPDILKNIMTYTCFRDRHALLSNPSLQAVLSACLDHGEVTSHVGKNLGVAARNMLAKCRDNVRLVPVLRPRIAGILDDLLKGPGDLAPDSVDSCLDIARSLYNDDPDSAVSLMRRLSPHARESAGMHLLTRCKDVVDEDSSNAALLISLLGAWQLSADGISYVQDNSSLLIATLHELLHGNDEGAADKLQGIAASMTDDQKCALGRNIYNVLLMRGVLAVQKDNPLYLLGSELLAPQYRRIQSLKKWSEDDCKHMNMLAAFYRLQDNFSSAATMYQEVVAQGKKHAYPDQVGGALQSLIAGSGAKNRKKYERMYQEHLVDLVIAGVRALTDAPALIAAFGNKNSLPILVDDTLRPFIPSGGSDLLERLKFYLGVESGAASLMLDCSEQMRVAFLAQGVFHFIVQEDLSDDVRAHMNKLADALLERVKKSGIQDDADLKAACLVAEFERDLSAIWLNGTNTEKKIAALAKRVAAAVGELPVKGSTYARSFLLDIQARIFQAQKKHEEAVGCYIEKSCLRISDEAKQWALLGMVRNYRYMHEHEKAGRAFQKLQKYPGKNPSLVAQCAWESLQMDAGLDPDDAELYEQLYVNRERLPVSDRIAFLLHYAACLIESQDAIRAQECLDQVLSMRCAPAFLYHAHLLQADIHMAQSPPKIDMALACAREAVACAQNQTLVSQAMIRAYGVLVKKDALQEAFQLLQDLYGQRDTLDKTALAQVLDELNTHCYLAGNFADARRYAQERLSLVQGDDRVISASAIADACLQLGDVQGVRDAMNELPAKGKSLNRATRRIFEMVVELLETGGIKSVDWRIIQKYKDPKEGVGDQLLYKLLCLYLDQDCAQHAAYRQELMEQQQNPIARGLAQLHQAGHELSVGNYVGAMERLRRLESSPVAAIMHAPIERFRNKLDLNDALRRGHLNEMSLDALEGVKGCEWVRAYKKYQADGELPRCVAVALDEDQRGVTQEVQLFERLIRTWPEIDVLLSGQKPEGVDSVAALKKFQHEFGDLLHSVHAERIALFITLQEWLDSMWREGRCDVEVAQRYAVLPVDAHPGAVLTAKAIRALDAYNAHIIDDELNTSATEIYDEVREDVAAISAMQMVFPEIYEQIQPLLWELDANYRNHLLANWRQLDQSSDQQMQGLFNHALEQQDLEEAAAMLRMVIDSPAEIDEAVRMHARYRYLKPLLIDPNAAGIIGQHSEWLEMLISIDEYYSAEYDEQRVRAWLKLQPLMMKLQPEKYLRKLQLIADQEFDMQQRHWAMLQLADQGGFDALEQYRIVANESSDDAVRFHADAGMLRCRLQKANIPWGDCKALEDHPNLRRELEAMYSRSIQYPYVQAMLAPYAVGLNPWKRRALLGAIVQNAQLNASEVVAWAQRELEDYSRR